MDLGFLQGFGEAAMGFGCLNGLDFDRQMDVILIKRVSVKE